MSPANSVSLTDSDMPGSVQLKAEMMLLRMVFVIALCGCSGASGRGSAVQMGADDSADSCSHVSQDWRTSAPAGWHEERVGAPVVVNPANHEMKYFSDRVGVVLVDSLDGRGMCRLLTQLSARIVGRLSLGNDSQPLFVLAIPHLGTSFSAFTASLSQLRADPRVRDVIALGSGEHLFFPGDVKQ